MRVLQETDMLLERGHRVSLVCRPGSPLEKRCRLLSSLSFDYRPIDMKMSPGAFALLYRYFREKRPDIVHTHSSNDSWLGGLAGRFAGIPVVRSRHVSLPISDFFPNHLLYSYFPERIITSGTAISEMVTQIRGVDPNKVVSISAGVDLRRFDMTLSGDIIRADLKVRPSQPLVGKVGVIRGWKGYDEFLEAIPIILEKVSEARFVIVGDGPGFEQIQSKVWAAGLGDRITLLGYREDVPEIMAALDVQVLASHSGEGTPQVIPQAFAMRTPVVATSIASIPDLLGNGERGVLIEPRNPRSLAEGVLKLIGDPDRAVRLAENAYSFCRKELTVDKMIDATLAVYEAVLSSPAK